MRLYISHLDITPLLQHMETLSYVRFSNTTLPYMDAIGAGHRHIVLAIRLLLASVHQPKYVEIYTLEMRSDF